MIWHPYAQGRGWNHGGIYKYILWGRKATLTRVCVVTPPVWADTGLTSQIPDLELQILVRHCFNIEADCGYCRDDFADLQSAQNRLMKEVATLIINCSSENDSMSKLMLRFLVLFTGWYHGPVQDGSFACAVETKDEDSSFFRPKQSRK